MELSCSASDRFGKFSTEFNHDQYIPPAVFERRSARRYGRVAACPHQIARGRANERVRVAVIGCGGQGNAHIRSLKSLDGVEVAYVCDVDREHLATAAKAAETSKPVADFRAFSTTNRSTP